MQLRKEKEIGVTGQTDCQTCVERQQLGSSIHFLVDLEKGERVPVASQILSKAEEQDFELESDSPPKRRTVIVSSLI